MDPITSRDLPVIAFPLMNVRYRTRVPQAVLDTGRVTVDRDSDAFLLDHVVVTLSAKILAEKLPPQQITDTVTGPRWATWWDHLKATYRDRWWIWYPTDFGWIKPARTVQTPIAVTVPVLANWTYPNASLRISDSFGSAVLYTTTERPYLGWPQ